MTLLERAARLFPGGVNSPVRSFRGVGGEPIFMAAGSGARITDTSGRQYLDYVGSWGPLLLGHCHPQVVQALEQQLQKGLSFGATCPAELELAELILDRLPDPLQTLRFVNSGTEAGMTAIRLARGCTGRDLIVKFSGGYHGHSDSLLVRAGSGAQTLGVQDSAGVPAALASLTRVLPYNDSEALEALFETEGPHIAAVLVEPVAGNMGMVLPQPGFLEQLRRCCDAHGTLLIFDEVMTGFRVAHGSAAGLFGVLPDLMMLGKVIGGGLPVGAVAGRDQWMRQLAPEGDVYQAGTLSGNPLAMVAGNATLQLANAKLYQRLESLAGDLIAGLTERARGAGIPFSGCALGAMFGLFFSPECPQRLEQIDERAVTLYRQFFHHMLQQGIYFPPSAYESCFLSSAHGPDELEQTLQAADRAFRDIRQ